MADPAPLPLIIRLNLESSVQITEQGSPLSMRGLGRILLHLALLQGASTPRPVMARLLWPGDEDEVAANRLRVSLNRVKALVGDKLVADRTAVRLTGVSVSLDLEKRETQLREVLDDVDSEEQFRQLLSFAPEIRYVGWREYVPLDGSGILRQWDATCRMAVERLMALARSRQDGDTLNLAWNLMRERGDFEPSLCEQFLDASAERGEIDEAWRQIRTAARAHGLDESGRVMTDLKKHMAGLKPAKLGTASLQSGHFHLLGAALLNEIDHHAEELGHLLSRSEVQINMQAAPGLYLEVLDAVGSHLEPGSPAWIEIQSSRVSVYNSLYDNERAAEVCQTLFPFEMSPNRAGLIYMSYAFSLFQVRKWDEALAAIRRGQEIAKAGGDEARYAITRMNEGTFLKHLGRVDEARAIYDDYLAQFADSENANDQFNVAVCRANYAYLEIVFGDLVEAAERAEAAYAVRSHVNLTRLIPNLISMMSVICARQGDLARATEFAIEGLKLTYARNSSREGQMNLEWACGVLVEGGLREEAWSIMHWANEWRQRTKHTRSVCEERYAASLALNDLSGTAPKFAPEAEYREVMRFAIRWLRQVQRNQNPPSG